MTEPREYLGETRRLGWKPTAVHDALLILEEVARCGAGVTAQEITANLKLPKATAYRLLNVLVEEEYLVRLSDLRGFALGARVRHLVAPRFVHVSRAAREVVDDLRNHSRAGIHLATFGRSGVDTIDVDPDYPLYSHDAVFRRCSATALGRLLEAYRHPRQSVSVDFGSARGDVVAASGPPPFAMQLGRLRDGFGCLAVPIFVDDATTPAAALAFSGTVARVQAAAADLGDLQRGARQLGRLL